MLATAAVRPSAEALRERNFDRLFDRLEGDGLFDGLFTVTGPDDPRGVVTVHTLADPVVFQALDDADHELHVRVDSRTFAVPGVGNPFADVAACLRRFASELSAAADLIEVKG